MNSTLSHLRRGDVFRHSGLNMVVQYVNASRARAVPLDPIIRTVQPKPMQGVEFEPKTFQEPAERHAINISPNSEVEILRSIPEKELDAIFSKKKRGHSAEVTEAPETETTEQETAMIKPAVKPIQNPRGGLAAESKKLGAASRPAATKAKAKKKTKATPKAAKPPGDRKPSKCSMIDDLFEVGTYTKSQILEKVLEAFPGSKKEATMSTINVRPSHMKRAGRKATWLPEKEEKK